VLSTSKRRKGYGYYSSSKGEEQFNTLEGTNQESESSEEALEEASQGSLEETHLTGSTLPTFHRHAYPLLPPTDQPQFGLSQPFPT